MPFDGQTYTKPDTHLADILRAAWKKIEQDGWRKCGSHAQGGWASMCIVSAAYWAGVERATYHEGYLATRALERALPDGFDYVPAYNDHPDTTLADMRALFQKAISLVEGGR